MTCTNIYYQDEFCGKEIAKSLSRYVRYCLGEKYVEVKELDINSITIVDNPSHKYTIVFTGLEHKSTYWITLFNNVVTAINEKECYLKIVDFTWRKGFPFRDSSEQSLSILEEGCVDWLTKFDEWQYMPLKIELTNGILKQFCIDVEHETKKGKDDYKSTLEKYIYVFGWNENLKESLIDTCTKYDGK